MFVLNQEMEKQEKQEVQILFALFLKRVVF